MLGSADPSQARGREVTVRAALDDAAKKIDAGAMRGQPEVEVAVRNAIGTTYDGLGVFEEAERQLRAALDLESRSARNPVVLADTNARLVNVLYKLQKYAEAQPVAEAAVKLRQEALGPRHADTAASLDDLGAILLQNGDVAAAEAKMREALAIRREVLGPDDPQLSTSLNNVGFVLQEKGDVDQAQAMFLESLAIDRRRLGNDHPEVAIKLVNLARLNNNQNKKEAAEPFAREAVAIRRKVLGNEHPGLVNALDQLSSAVELREPAEAERLSREALAISTRAYGANHRETARLQNNLGFILYKQGGYQEAVTLYRAATDTFRQTLGADTPLTLGAQVGLAQNLNAMGEFRAAEATMREVLAVYRKQPTNKQVTTTLMALGVRITLNGESRCTHRRGNGLCVLNEKATEPFADAGGLNEQCRKLHVSVALLCQSIEANEALRMLQDEKAPIFGKQVFLAIRQLVTTRLKKLRRVAPVCLRAQSHIAQQRSLTGSCGADAMNVSIAC
jgi:tetratricopeptide (TPR) repeat protein